ncbi:MAG: GNAT family N-acetyltransferase [Hyphomonadaceae bacterium]|nr:GNAT family N-acetyltransferase [Hyphomonadaceae bacterium]
MRDTIETNRLTLRPFTASDAATVTRLVGDWDVARMCARIPHPYREDDAKQWLATLPKARAEGASFTFAVTSAKDGVIGAIGLTRRDADETFEIGYWLGKPYWGQGYATEAGATVLAYAVEDLGEKRFQAQHFEENAPSGAVLQKLGFRYTGDVRAMHCLARGAKVPARLMKRTPEREAANDS